MRGIRLSRKAQAEKQRNTQTGGSRHPNFEDVSKLKKYREKVNRRKANARGSYSLPCRLLNLAQILTFDTPSYLVFLYVFPIMGACCAQIKGFTLGCRELVLVRPNVKPFI